MSKKQWWFCSLLILTLLVFSLFFLALFGVRNIPDLKQSRGEILSRIWGENIVGQTIIPGHNNFNILVVNLKNPALKNKKPLIFHLREEETESDLRTIKLNGLNIGDPSSIRLQFDPITDSLGKQYYFFFESRASTHEEPIEVYHHDEDVYKNGQMIINGQPKEGDLQFVSYYRALSKKVLIKSFFFQFWERFFFDKIFAVFYCLLLLLMPTISLTIKKKNNG